MMEFVNSIMPFFIILLMAGVGLSVSFQQLGQSLGKWKIMLATVFSMQVILPLICIGLASMLTLQPDIAVGFVLLASCPGGLFSNYLVLLARADTALSISLTVFITLIYAITAPLWAGAALHLFMPEGTAIRGYDPWSVLISLVGFVLVPTVVGVALKTKRPILADRIGAVIRNPAAIGLLLMYFLILYDLRDTLIIGAKAAIIPVFLFNLFGAALGAGISVFLGWKSQQGIPVIVEHVVRQEGTGIFIASALIDSVAMTYPMLLNSLTGMIIGLSLAVFFRRKARLSAKKSIIDPRNRND